MHDKNLGREEQVKNLISMDILKLCDEHKVNISIYYGYGNTIQITIYSRTSDRRAARVLFREDLPDDENLRSSYLSIVTTEMILLLKGEGIDTSMLFKKGESHDC